MRRLVCPYCFERFHRSEMLFRCLNPNPAQCSPEPDAALANYQRLNIPPKLGRVFSTSSQWRKARVVECSCGVKTSKLVCPFCHNDLPSQFGSTDVHTIALIGAKEAGKSHYIAVLVNELTNRIGMSFNASLNALDEQTIRRYRQDFRRWIYVDKVTIPPTVTARQQGSSVRYPLTYRFSIKRRGWLPFNGLHVSSLVFFDTAGEDLDHIDQMSTETKYLANSDGIIFLLDPLQIPSVRHQLPNNTLLPQENTDPIDIVGRAATLIRDMRGMRATDPIDTPVALAFSKIDSVRPLFDPGSPVHHASSHNGKFDVVDGQQMSDNMRAYLSQWIGNGLDLFMQHNFKNYSYFGVSSLGSHPDSQGRLGSGVAPFRVEDPLLWILFKLGIVQGKTRS